MKRRFGLLLAASLIPTTVIAQEIELNGLTRTGLSATFYARDFALIDETRAATLARGNVQLSIIDLPYQITTESLRVSSKELTVTAFGYDRAILSPQSLLQKYVGQEIEIATENPKTGVESRQKAKLLTVNGGPVFEINGEIVTEAPGRLIFPHRPSELRDQPALTVQGNSKEDGKHDINLNYLAGGFGWSANYVMVLGKNDEDLALTGRAALTNNSGMDLHDAAIAIMAGDVDPPVARSSPQPRMLKGMATMAVDSESTSVPRQSVGDRHLYTLPGRWSLGAGATKLVTLFDAPAVKVERHYLFTNRGAHQFRANTAPEKAEINLTLRNRDADGLGFALPGGQLHAYKQDHLGALRYLGRSTMVDTPVDGSIELSLGDAFDVTLNRTQTLFRHVGPKNRDVQTAWSLKIANSKDQPITVFIEETLAGDWKIIQSSHPVNFKTASTARWILEIPGQAERILTYEAEINYR